MPSIRKTRKASIIIAAVILVLSCLLSACGTSRQSEEASTAANTSKKAVLLYHFKSSTLDPSNDAIAVKAGIAETLVKLDGDLNIQPWLAEQWTQVDNLTWRFTIRQGVTFHDGTPLDGAAVKASLERAIAANASLGKALRIASMKAGGQKLTIITSEPNPALASEFVNPYTAILNVMAEKKVGTEAFNLAPIGTGPFKVMQFEPDIEIKLQRYDGYWDGAAKLNEAVFKFNEDGNVRALALQSGDVDIATQIPAETIETIKQDDQLAVESVTGLRVHFLLFNPSRPAMQSLPVRQALDLLLNRQSVANDIMLGYAAPANGPFNSKLPFGNNDPVQEQNIDQAKQKLAEAGYSLDAGGKMAKDGKPLELELLTYKARPELPLIAQLLQSDAAKAGVTINIRNVESVDTTIRESSDWDIVTYSNLSAPRGDGGFFLNAALMPGGSLNAANITIPALEQIVNELNQTGDPAKRIALTQQAVQVVKEQLPHAYIVYPNIIVGMNKRITGWKPGSEEYYVMTNKMDVR